MIKLFTILSYKHYYFTERESVCVEEPPDMIKRLERFQNRALKRLVSSPKNTPTAVVRILTGTMPISARIDILKLRYFWKLMHSGEDNMAYIIYKETRKKFLEGAVGYIHEIFNICCKYGAMGIWHGKCPKRANPLARIKRIVEAHHLNIDLAILRRSNCAYSSLRIFKEKRYTLEPWLLAIGRFPSSKHRRVFMYTLQDVSTYDRTCKHCGAKVRDMTSHGLQTCLKMLQQRGILELSFKLYNAPLEVDTSSKKQLLSAALSKKSLLKVVCDFLLIIWKWEE